jgi:hypothetical protein
LLSLAIRIVRAARAAIKSGAATIGGANAFYHFWSPSRRFELG